MSDGIWVKLDPSFTVDSGIIKPNLTSSFADTTLFADSGSHGIIHLTPIDIQNLGITNSMLNNDWYTWPRSTIATLNQRHPNTKLTDSITYNLLSSSARFAVVAKAPGCGNYKNKYCFNWTTYFQLDKWIPWTNPDASPQFPIPGGVGRFWVQRCDLGAKIGWCAGSSDFFVNGGVQNAKLGAKFIFGFHKPKFFITESTANSIINLIRRTGKNIPFMNCGFTTTLDIGITLNPNIYGSIVAAYSQNTLCRTQSNSPGVPYDEDQFVQKANVTIKGGVALKIAAGAAYSRETLNFNGVAVPQGFLSQKAAAQSLIDFLDQSNKVKVEADLLNVTGEVGGFFKFGWKGTTKFKDDISGITPESNNPNRNDNANYDLGLFLTGNATSLLKIEINGYKVGIAKVSWLNLGRLTYTKDQGFNYATPPNSFYNNMLDEEETQGVIPQPGTGN